MSTKALSVVLFSDISRQYEYMIHWRSCYLDHECLKW